MNMSSDVYIVLQCDLTAASGTLEGFYSFGQGGLTAPFIAFTGGKNLNMTYRAKDNSGLASSVADGLSTTSMNYWENQYGDGPYMVLQQNSGTVWNTNISYGATTLANLNLGRGWTGTSIRYGNCKIAEFICYNRALTASERVSIRNYLAAKWAI